LFLQRVKKCYKEQKTKLRREKMKRAQLSLSVLLLAGVMGYTPIAIAASAPPADPHKPKGVKPGVLSATALNREGTYCHLRFPSMRPSTLTSAKPQLKPARTADIVDFYGPCDYDPTGKEAVMKQKQVEDERLDNDFQ
jgi:hypothetical protein